MQAGRADLLQGMDDTSSAEYQALMHDLERSLYEGVRADEAAHLARLEAMDAEAEAAMLMGHMVRRPCPA